MTPNYFPEVSVCGKIFVALHVLFKGAENESC